MSYETISIEAKDSGTVHVLVGTVTDVDEEAVTVNIDIDGYGTFEDVSVFYHCEDEETADGMPFIKDKNDRVVIVNSGDPINLAVENLKVVGFEDGLPRKCPVETVYVAMKVGNTTRCFVWKIEDEEYASVKDNVGDPVSFPCNPADISNWIDSQESVGEGLIIAGNCGRILYCYGDLPDCVGGDWGTVGSTSDSKQELSDCNGCDFINTVECGFSWDLTGVCGSSSAGQTFGYLEQNILWGVDPSYGSRDFRFCNNSEVEDAFRVEIQSIENTTEYAVEGSSCGLPCDDIRLDDKVITRIYKFHTPIAADILQVTFVETGNCSTCADTGMRKQENFVVPMRLKAYGAYSEKVITQIYFVEVQTITRSANCDFVYGQCCGSGCVRNGCPWASQVFTSHGLSVAAQADILENTDGVDPTELPRNELFEDAINKLYDVLRVAESVPKDKIAGARLTALHVLKGG